MELVRLRTVVMENFKSYRGINKVGPFDNFSCIIGPNGSGKSNVMDAITFAMGVETKNLRALNLSDLVCREEDKTAVTLVFEDISRSEEHHVSVNTFETKRVYMQKQNRSVYMLDGRVVTFEEYNRFYENKLNIFRRIRNFVIYQGTILNSNPDLLGIVETISGSIGYADEYEKCRKHLLEQNKELSRKFERKKDLLGDIKEYEASQNKKAVFSELLTKKEEIVKRHFACELGILWKKKRIIENEYLQYVKKLELMEKNTEYVNMREAMHKVSREILYKKKEMDEIYIIEKLRDEKHSAGELSEAEIRKKIEEKKQKLGEIDRELKRLCASPELVYGDEKQNKENDRKEFEEKLEKAVLKAKEETEEEERRILEMTIENYEAISEKEDNDLRKKQMDERIKRRKEEVERINKKIIENRQKVEMLVDEKKRLLINKEERKKFEEIERELNRLNEELVSATKEILLFKAKKQEVKNKLFVTNTIETIKSLFPGVFGRISGLISATQKKYEVAVNTILSKYETTVLVDSKDTALSCIEYLKSAKLTKLTFIVLERLHAGNRELDSPAIVPETPIYDYVSCDFPPVIEYIFSNTTIVESVEEAKDVVYNTREYKTAVTMEGILFHSNGLITGGFKKTMKDNTEESKIEEMIKQRRKVLELLREAKVRKEGYQDIQKKLEQEKKIVEEIDQIKKEDFRIDQPSEEEIEKYKECLRKEESLKRDLETFEAEKNVLEERIRAKEREIVAPLLRLVNVSSLKEYRRRQSEQLERNRLEMEKCSVEGEISSFVELLSTSAKEQRHESTNEKTIEKISDELDRLRDQMRKLSFSYSKVALETENLNDKIKNYALVKIKNAEDLDERLKYCFIETDFASEAEIDALFNEMVEEAIRESTVDKNSMKMLSNTYKEKLIIEKMMIKAKELKNKLVSINDQLVRNTPTDVGETNQLHSKFLKFNREYEEAKEYAAISRDHFNRIKEMRIELFNKCLDALQTEINSVYRKLAYNEFSLPADDAGKVSYVVSEGSSPFLPNSLKYYVMPPGKGFTEFRMLSGGEKSLALLAFIFSLNALKKPSFYLFDEIDQALDRENLQRMINFLREDSANSQYILISLKSQLFSCANSLFGIYKDHLMQQSKILSYKLHDEN